MQFALSPLSHWGDGLGRDELHDLTVPLADEVNEQTTIVSMDFVTGILLDSFFLRG